jgi:hypothetical protein
VTLVAGTRLGPYEILSPLAAGGMGQVYRARDTRLDRTVAVKVLADHLALSSEVRQRFEREARTISSLSHPHICTLFDVGREGEVDFLVMELLEGQSLAQRLESGPLPIDEVLRLGIQIADALEKAHASGVVHRDLKPGNIMLTESGVKLLDFGLAKMLVAPTTSSATALQHLVTEAGAPLTTEGTLLGTFQYMSPEQLEGREAGAVSDIFAFGAVLYEMATAHKAFSGKSQASLIGSIMHSVPPPVSTVVPLAPPAFDRVVATCLAKDPRDRWQTVHDIRLELVWVAEGGSRIGVPVPVALRRKHRERLAWGVAAVATLAALGFAVGFLRRAPAPPELVRFHVPQPPKLPVVGSPKMSPDGRLLAFNATDDDGVSRLWVRALAALEPRPLAGTEGARRPFWSPDSRYLGFVAGGKLKKVDVTGSPPQTICDAPTGSDGTWSEDGTILFDGQSDDPIRKVSAGGGVATALIDGKKSLVGWPQFLPGGERFLYVDVSSGSTQGIRVAKADGSDAREVVSGLSRVEYAPPGYLLFVRDATLVAQRFDAAAAKLVGDPVPVAEGLGTDAVGLADFSASRNGVLAYRAGLSGQSEYVLLDRKGNRTAVASDPGTLSSFDISPTGAGWSTWSDHPTPRISGCAISSAACPRASPSTTAVKWRRCSVATAARSSSRAGSPASRTAFSCGRSTAAPASVCCSNPRARSARTGLTPDGKTLIFSLRPENGEWGIWSVPLGHPDQAAALVTSKFANSRAALSPDGRWLAFESNESGEPEIYVVGMNGGGGRWQISTRGGVEPHWSVDGKELFYVSPESKVMHVAVLPGATFDTGPSAPLFPITLPSAAGRTRFNVTPDGTGFLVLTPKGDGAGPPTTVVLNWQTVLAH